MVNLKINYNQLFPARVGDARDSTSLKIMNETGVVSLGLSIPTAHRPLL